MTPPACDDHWEHFEHMADMGVRGVAQDLPTAFEQAALALTGIVTEPDQIHPTKTVTVACEAPDPELLLYDWLNAITYEMATRKLLFGRYRVTLTGDRLQAVLHGEPVDRLRHQPAVEVKGATFTELKVYQRADGCWIAQCVVDV